MSLRAHISILVLSVATLAFILRLVRRRRLRAKYSVLWVSLGAGLAILASAPTLIERFSDLLGIKTPALTFLLMAITFLLVLSLHFSWELSRLEDRMRALAEESALLRERLGELLDVEQVARRGTRPSGQGRASHDDEAVRGEGRAQAADGPLEPEQRGAAGPNEPQLP